MFRKKGYGFNERESRADSGFDDILITRRLTEDYLRSQGLDKFWRISYLWALGAGTVISAAYVRWGKAFAVSTLQEFLAALMLISFVYFVFLSVVSELGTIFPYAGGPYAYVRRGLGTLGGYAAGVLLSCSQLFALAGLLFILRSFLETFYLIGWEQGLVVGLFALILMVQVIDARIGAALQFLLACGAISGLILFIIGSSSTLDFHPYLNFQQRSFSIHGLVAALPAVVWFYLGLEVLPTAAEETKDVSRNLPYGIFFSLATAFSVAAAVTVFAVGAVSPSVLSTGEYPLHRVLQTVQSGDQVLLKTFTAVSICAFVTGINGLISGYSRQVYALARAGYFPFRLSRLDQKRRVPYLAILIPGILAVTLFLFSSLQVLAAGAFFSAAALQLLVFVSYIRIYRSEAELFGFSGFLYRSGAIALAMMLTAAALAAIICSYFAALGLMGCLLSMALVVYFFRRGSIREDAPEESRAVSLEKRIEIHFH